MPRTTINLNQNDVADAIRFWVENGMQKPKNRKPVSFSYDDPNKGNQFDHGNGVSATIEV